jgi:catechol 2,3-dioxygenase-like lactoylglutathione lyase family enzyme
VDFYSKLFGAEPAKRQPGYANFAIAEPPLKLILMENPGQGGSLNHLGVEVADTDAVDAEQARLAEAGLAAVEERDTTCCYARQDKFWVKGAPGGERWEVYTVLEDSATFWGQDGGQSWDAAQSALGTVPGGQAAGSPGPGSPCCGGQQQGGGADDATAGVCCA